MMRHKHRILQVMSGLAEAVNLLLPTELLPRFLQTISRLAFATVLFYFLPSTSVPNDGISYQYVVYGAAVSSGWDTRSYYTNSYDSILGYQTINDQRWQITPRSLLASHVGIYDADGGCEGGTIDRIFHTQRQFFPYISGNPRMFRAASTAGGSAANIVNAVSHCGPWPVCQAGTTAPMSRRHFVQLHFHLSSPTRVRIVSYAAYAFSFGGYDILSDLTSGNATGGTSIYHASSQRYVYVRPIDINRSGMDYDQRSLLLPAGDYILNHDVFAGDYAAYYTECSQVGMDYVASSFAGSAAGLSGAVFLIFGSSQEIPDITILLADIDGDGCITDADLLAVLMNLGSEFGSGDVNLDGVVDDADLLIVLSLMGECYL